MVLNHKSFNISVYLQIIYLWITRAYSSVCCGDNFKVCSNMVYSDVSNCPQIEKNPEDYNDEDLKIIKDYEEKVALHLSERESYREMLETEFQKLSQTIKVRKFSHLTSIPVLNRSYDISLYYIR